jgi:uncharacterized membrane protein YkvA (DUF1232 family)
MNFLKQIVHKFLRNSFRHPKYRWFFIAASLIYLISPFDISPDVFPIIGWLDDGMLITLLASEVSQVLIERRKAKKEESATVSSSSVSS